MTRPSFGYAVETRTGRGDINNTAQEFEIDFTGNGLASLPLKDVSAVIGVGKEARLLEHRIVKNDFIGGLRLGFQLQPTAKPVQLSAFLRYKDKAITETWHYVFRPVQ